MPSKNSNISIRSPDFNNNGFIPREFTCDGSRLTPRITIENIPKNAKSLALIMDDPDAPMGTFVHWVVWNIPAPTANIEDGISGINSAQKKGYTPPCPPSGIHRYFFRVYALDATLALNSNSDKNDLLNAMENHIISSSEIIGKYERK